MLSSDLSVFDDILPTLDPRLQVLILFCVQAIPVLITPVLVLTLSRCKKRSKRNSDSGLSRSHIRPEVQKKVKALLEMKKLSACRTLIDLPLCLTAVFVFYVWLKSYQFGIQTIPAFDLCLTPACLPWLLFIAAYQADWLPQGTRTAAVVAFSYNMMLVWNQVLLTWLNVQDRDVMLMVCRLFAGFIFCDHRLAAAFQLVFVGLKTKAPPHVSNPNNGYNEIWDVFLWEIFQQIVCVVPMWAMWFSVEYFVKWITELMVQRADVNASLDAARSVLASQCDAEAYLRADLTFQNPSAKMAHFFGMKTEDLKDRRFTDLVDERDLPRFQKLLDDTAQRYAQDLPAPGAASLTLTLRHSSGRKIETQIYLGSIPGMLEEKPCHLIAFNEVCDTAGEKVPPVEEAVDNKIEEPQVTPAVENMKRGTSSEHLPLNKDTLAFHAWSFGKNEGGQTAGSIDSVSVVFESQSLEVKEIFLKLASNSKTKRKTLLSDCIIPGVWEQLRQSLEATKTNNPEAAAPPIVPFVFPKFVTAALAARFTEIKRRPNKAADSKELVLILSDIRLRRFQSAGSHGPRTIGQGTASRVSRCSLDDRGPLGSLAA